MICGHLLCDRPVDRVGLCRGHYARLERGASIAPPLREYKRQQPTCIDPGCDRDVHAKSLCKRHYYKTLQPLRIGRSKAVAVGIGAPVVSILRQCHVPGCTGERIAAVPLCYGHSRALRRSA